MSAVARYRRICSKIGLPLSRIFTEHFVLARISIVRRILRRVMRVRLEEIEQVLDPDFYLMQIRSPADKERAARDPALHYAMVGAFRSFAPSSSFDPIFYRGWHPDLSWVGNPVHHHMRRGRLGPTSANEIAATEPIRHSGANAPMGCALTLHHDRGGGSARFLALYEQSLSDRGYRVVRLARVSRPEPLFRAFDRENGRPVGAAFHLFDDQHVLQNLFRELAVSRFVVNHIIDLPVAVFSTIPDLCRTAAIAFEIILHDYFLICPRVNLVNGSGNYCGEPAVTRCRSCIESSGSEAGSVDPSEWRRRAEDFARQADRVIAPSNDAASRFARYWPGLNIDVWNPEDDATMPSPIEPALSADEPLKIAVMGSVNIAKGFRVLEQLAHRVARRRLPIQFVCIGESIDDAALRNHGVKIRGRYRESELDDILKSEAPHIVLQPAIWPETWSFVASAALRQRIPVYAFDIGAIPQRLSRLEQNTILPLGLAAQPDTLIEHLLRVRAARMTVTVAHH